MSRDSGHSKRLLLLGRRGTRTMNFMLLMSTRRTDTDRLSPTRADERRQRLIGLRAISLLVIGLLSATTAGVEAANDAHTCGSACRSDVGPAQLHAALHLAGASGALQQRDRALPALPEGDLDRIRAAVPSTATAEPAAPRTILVFTATKGFRHASIPHGVTALTLMGEATGAFTVEHSEDMLMFMPGRLDRFDAIVFLNSTGELFEEAVHRDALIDFVRRGKGIVGIHAASDACYRWEKYGRLIGGYFDGHPWNANDTVTIRPEDPEHPVVKRAFNGEPQTFKEEIYQIRAPYSRDFLRVLVTLDTTQTDMTRPGIRRTDGDFPVSWIQTYEGGRIFYTSLGHREDIYWNSKILQHYLDGIQYAIGDLEADATPSAQLTLSADEAIDMAIPKAIREALAALPAYEFGESRYMLSLISDHVHKTTAGSDAEQQAIEKALISVLQSREASRDAREFACRQLALIGGRESVLPLVSKVADPELRHLAVAALAVNPTKEAGEALVVALIQIPFGDPPARALVLHALTDRKEAALLDLLPRIGARDDDHLDVLIAIARAWGALGGVGAEDELQRLHAIGEERASTQLQSTAIHGLLALGERLAASTREEDREAANQIGRRLDSTSMPQAVQLAGLRLRALSAPAETVPDIVRLLESDDPEVYGSAASLVRTMQGRNVDAALNESFTRLDLTGQIRLVRALGERGHPAAINLATELVHHPSDDMKIAASEALGIIGTRGSALTLAELAGLSTGAVQQAARENMYRIKRPNARAVEQVMGQAVTRFRSEATRVELIDGLRIRRAAEQAPILRQTILEDSPAIRVASWHALGALDSPQSLGLLIRQFITIDPTDREEKEAAADAITAIALRSDDANAAAGPLASAIITDASVENTVLLLGMLGELGGSAALKAVEGVLFDSAFDALAKDAAVSVLARWEDAEALPTVEALLADPEGPDAWRATLFEGAVRLIGNTIPDHQAETKSKKLRDLMDSATTDHERVLVLEGLAAAPHIDSLSLVQAELSNPALTLAAARAMFAIGQTIGMRNQDAGVDIVMQALTKAEEVAQAHPRAISSEQLEGLQSAAGAAVNAIDAQRGFITAWLIAGPYMIEGQGGSDLFDHAFEPETNPDSAEWSRPADGVVSPRGVVDFNRAFAGSDRVAYVRTIITSDRAQSARIELGSDDGAKVWLNGEVVHANNAMRGLTLGEDVFEAQLTEGSNVLLIKVSQGGGDWSLAVRLRGAMGFRLDGVDVTAE